MAQTQKPVFVLRRNGRVHLDGRGRQFSPLLAAEVCASTVVLLDTPCSEVVWRVLATHFIRQFLLRFPSRASPRAITFQQESTFRPTVGRIYTIIVINVCYQVQNKIVLLSIQKYIRSLEISTSCDSISIIFTLYSAPLLSWLLINSAKYWLLNCVLESLLKRVNNEGGNIKHRVTVRKVMPHMHYFEIKIDACVDKSKGERFRYFDQQSLHK